MNKKVFSVKFYIHSNFSYVESGNKTDAKKWAENVINERISKIENILRAKIYSYEIQDVINHKEINDCDYDVHFVIKGITLTKSIDEKNAIDEINNMISENIQKIEELFFGIAMWDDNYICSVDEIS